MSFCIWRKQILQDCEHLLWLCSCTHINMYVTTEWFVSSAFLIRLRRLARHITSHAMISPKGPELSWGKAWAKSGQALINIQTKHNILLKYSGNLLIVHRCCWNAKISFGFVAIIINTTFHYTLIYWWTPQVFANLGYFELHHNGHRSINILLEYWHQYL